MLQPYYDSTSITIYYGDARAVLPQLPSCDLLLTDPPYGVQYVTNHRLKGDPLIAPIAGDEDLSMLRSVLPTAFAALRQDRHAYFFASPLMLGAVQNLLRQYFTVKNILVWDKGEGGTAGDLDGDFARAWEAIVFAHKGRRAIFGKRLRNVLHQDWSTRSNPVHPTVKPHELMMKLIEASTQPGELVLDPFMGSGPVLIAAKMLGRRAIGIEIEEQYCKVAAAALDATPLPLPIEQEPQQVQMEL